MSHSSLTYTVENKIAWFGLPCIHIPRGQFSPCHFLAHFRQQTGRHVAGFSDEALAALQAYDWPGNVRELANCVERAVVLCRGGRIGPGDLPGEITGRRPAGPAGGSGAAVVLPLAEALAGPEKEIIVDALAAFGGNRKAAAAALKIDRTTLYKKMRKFGLLVGRKPS